MLGQALEREHSLFDLLRRPDVSLRRAQCLRRRLSDDARGGRAGGDRGQVRRLHRSPDGRGRSASSRRKTSRIPAELDYAAVRGLSREVQQKLAQHRPETIGQASRIQGMTPAAISLLLVHLKRRASRGAAHREDAHEPGSTIAEGLAAMGVALPTRAPRATAQPTSSSSRNGIASTTSPRCASPTQMVVLHVLDSLSVLPHLGDGADAARRRQRRRLPGHSARDRAARPRR